MTNLPSAPTSSDEWAVESELGTGTKMIHRNAFKKGSTFAERFSRFAPGILLQIFALVKFALILYILYFSTNRPWHDIEIPLVVAVLVLNAFLLISATTQDFCTLIVSCITTSTLLIIYIVLLIIIPIFVTSFFASGADQQVKIPDEWRIFKDIIHYKSREERRFEKGLEYGMSVEFFLFFLVIVTLIQFALLNATLTAKFEQLKREKQEREKRNSVYLI